MTPGAGRHRAADDPDEPAAEPSAPPALPPFAAAQYGPPPPFVAPQAPFGPPPPVAAPQVSYEPPPPFVPPSAQHAPLLERALQRNAEPASDAEPPSDAKSSFDYAPPWAYAEPLAAESAPLHEPVFIPLRPPRRSHRNLGTVAAAGLAIAVVLVGGYVYLTRPTPDPAAQAAAPITIHLPSTTASTSPVARTKTTVVHLPVKYRSAKGHFAVHFAYQPTAGTQETALGGRRITTYRVIDVQGKAMVEAADFPDLSPSRYGPVLDAGIAGIRGALGSSAAVTSSATTFRKQPARSFTLTASDGTALTGVVTIFPGTRFYVLMAPSGAEFRALEKSFRTLP